MGDERNLVEARERTDAETVCSQDPPMKFYGLTDQGKVLASSTEDKEPTTPIPPSDDKVQSSQTVVGSTQFSYVMSITLACNNTLSSPHLHRLRRNQAN